MGNLNKITSERLLKAIEGARSIADVIRNLGYDPDQNSRYQQVRALAITYNVVLPRAKNGTRRGPATRIPDDEFFSSGTIRSGTALRERMVRCGVRYSCNNSDCLLHEAEEMVWAGVPITLQVDHIDGDHYNNELANLRFLCPNCHSQTDTYARGNCRPMTDCSCGRKTLAIFEGHDCYHNEFGVLRYRNACQECGTGVDGKSTRCKPCAGRVNRGKKKPTSFNYPPVKEMVLKIEEMGYSAYSREIGATDNAIRKHLRREGVDPLPKRITRLQREKMYGRLT